jgi:hypothetical protein
MLYALKAVALTVLLTSTSLAGGFDPAIAGVPSAVTAAPAVTRGGAIERVRWVRRCNCRQHWVASHRRSVSRRSWVVRHRHPPWVGSCWRWRATHWGIGRVWSCY